MITKRIDGRKDGKSSAKDAFRYGAGLTPDRETGQLLDKAHRIRFGNFGLVDDVVLTGGHPPGIDELIELAALEMQANGALNTRVKDWQKIAHFIASFGQEKPSDAALRDTEDSMLAALDLSDNHFATFLHNDNGQWHLHFFVSRIEKNKPHRCNQLWHDELKRDKVCREIELRHNLTRDNGAHEINEAGKIVEVPKEERRHRREKREKDNPQLTDKAVSKEKYSGEKSFQTWCNEIRIGDRLKHAKSWKELSAAAAAYGCEVKKKGAGFVLCPVGQKGGIQLSKVGLKNLGKRFGEYPENGIEHDQGDTLVIDTYKPGPTREEGNDLFATWETAKDAFKPIREAEMDKLKELQKAARQQIKDDHKLELANIRSTTKRGEPRETAISIAKFAHAAHMSALTAEFAAQRQRRRDQLRAEGPGNTFREFLVREAQAGNDEALALAQKYGEAEATEVSKKREADELQVVATATSHNLDLEIKPHRLTFTHRVKWNGSVVYDLGDGVQIIDSAPDRQIQLNKLAATDPVAIEQGLRFAMAKFGQTLTLTGSADFQRRAVELAVQQGLNCKFVDPSLEAYRQKLAAEREAEFNKPKFAKQQTQTPEKEQHHGKTSRTTQQQTQPGPPPHRRDRLHYLSDSDLVLNTHGDELLLQSDVPDRVELDQDGQPDHRLQREGASGGRSPGGNSGLNPSANPAPKAPKDQGGGRGR